MKEFKEIYERNKSTPLFLYFLDRELLETHNMYDNIKQIKISRDIRMCLFSSLNEVYMPASFLFESMYAYNFFKEYNLLFDNEKIIVVMTYDDLNKMVHTKREQYKGHETLYPNYFNNFWEEILKGNVSFRHKNSNTTLFIEKNIEERLKNIGKNKIKIPYIMEQIFMHNIVMNYLHGGQYA